METKTVAEIISHKFGDNGSCFVADDGRQLTECLEEECTGKTTAGGDEVRFEFSDHSVIVVAGGAWDLGYPDSRCHCWVSTGHHAECESSD